MNKNRLPFILFMVVAMMSCSQDEYHDIELIDNHITATISETVSSRTLLSDKQVLWLADDDISVILSTGYHNRYVVSGAVNSNSTDFSIDSSIQSINLNKRLPSHYAIYPYSPDYTVSDDLKTIIVDADLREQNYVENSFEDDKAIMTAKSNDKNFSFYNAFSLLVFRLNADADGCYSISKIIVTSKDIALNGEATIDMSVDKPQLICTGTSSENMINELIISNEVFLTQEPIDFYLLIPAGEYGVDPDKRLVVNIKGKNWENNTELDWSYTADEKIECIRSKKTILTYTFKSTGFSGSTEGDINN